MQHLEARLTDKDNLFGQLQTEYNSLLENSKKDEKMLIKKHNMLYAIGRENNKLRQQLSRLSEEVGDSGTEKVLQESMVADQSLLEDIETTMM